MSKIVALLSAPVPSDLREQLAQHFELLSVPMGQAPHTSLSSEQLATVSGYMVAGGNRCTPEIMDSMPALKVVSNFGVGYDNISVPAATQRGILVCNTPGVLNEAVADLTLGLIIACGRNMVQGDAYVRNGSWERQGPPAVTSDIRGKTLGLLGMGRIGLELARTVQALRMPVIYHNRNRNEQAEAQGLAQYRKRDALFAEADFLCILTPLTPETRHSVGVHEFSLMKPSAYLINTARGAIINEADLIQALESGQIAGAGLDVMEQEPLPANHPFCRLPNTILQAHMGSATRETRRAMITLAVENLQDALLGISPKAMVNPEVWQQ